jgi:trimeric autotransporter adhesin
MKWNITYLLGLLAMASTIQTHAQVPQAISYQAVARDSAGNVLAGQNISLRLSIRDSIATGTIVYSETHNVITNTLGLFSASIGTGTPIVGTFAGINWASNPKFMQVEMDASGGVAYVEMSTQQMMSVPYALHAGSSNSTWNLTGNVGTIDSTNFIGTIDNVPLNFRVNNQNVGRIDIEQGIITFGKLAGNALTISATNNILIGDSAGYNFTTGDNSIFIGSRAGIKTTTGQENMFLGFKAGANNTTGGHNCFIGNYAGEDNTTGDFNAFFGRLAGADNSTGAANTYFGVEAGRFNDTSNFNAYFGYRSGWRSSGEGNSFFGAYSGPFNSSSTGSSNSIFGHGSGYHLTTGSHNAFLGHAAGYQNTTGTANTFIGKSAGFYNTDGISNSFVGRRCGVHNTTGSHNSYLGDSTVYYGTTGSMNVAIGKLAGISNLTGSNNTLIGYAADVDISGNLSNATAIGAQARVNVSNALVLGSISGVNGAINSVNVGIGTPAPGERLEVHGRVLLSNGFSTDNAALVYNNNTDYLFLGPRSGSSVNGASMALYGTTNNVGGNPNGIDFRTGSLAMRMLSNGYVGIGVPAPVAKLDILGAGSTSSTASLNIRNSASTLLMYVRDDGNVGLGTSLPDSKLDVRGSIKGYDSYFGNTNGGYGISLGTSGGNYGSIGYGLTYTGTSGSYLYRINDFSSMLQFNAGGFDFNTAPNGSTGNAISYTTVMKILQNGNIGIGISPTQKLHVNGNGVFTGTVTASCGVLACSDLRYKHTIKPLQHSLEKIMQLHGVSYFWKADQFPELGFTADKQIGVIAQDLEKQFPELVQTDEEGFKTVDYAKLTPVLIEAMKELAAKNEALEAENRKMKADIESIKNYLGMEAKAYQVE